MQPRLVSVISPVPESRITFSPTDTSTSPSVSAVDQAHPQNLFPSTFLSPILPFHEDASLYSIKHLLWLREHDKRFLDEGMDFSRLDDQSIKKIIHSYNDQGLVVPNSHRHKPSQI